MTARAQARVRFKDFKGIVRKGSLDPFWISNIFWRPFSVYVSWPLAALRVPANAITAVSCVFAVIGSLVVLYPSTAAYVASVVFMQVFFFLDHVDGEVSRFERVRTGERAYVDRSGGYFDRLVHYFQGPSFFFCLGAGLGIADANPLWAILGVVGGIGSSGFPRFTASYELLTLLIDRSDDQAREFAGRYGGYYTIYWTPSDAVRPFFIIPRNFRELVVAAKQYIWFPGHMFVYAGAVVLMAVHGAGILWIKLYLAVYSAILGVNTIFATVSYLKILSAVPSAGGARTHGVAPGGDGRVAMVGSEAREG